MRDSLIENIICNFSNLGEKMKDNKKSDSPKRVKLFYKKFFGLTPFLFFLCLILMPPVIAQAASVTLTWNRNQEPDIAGYKIFYGTQSGHYTDSITVNDTANQPQQRSYTIAGLSEGTTYYFVLKAFDQIWQESGYSNEILLIITSSDEAGGSGTGGGTGGAGGSSSGGIGSIDPTSDTDVYTFTADPTSEEPQDPPAEQNVDECDATCQTTAPMTVADGVMDVNFNYTAPVEVIGGVMSEYFTTVWWLTDSCILSEDFGQAATDAAQFSCTDVAMPAGSDHGWVFWMVAPTATADFGNNEWWNSGAYELMWYQLP